MLSRSTLTAAHGAATFSEYRAALICRDSRKSRQKMAKNAAHFCENRKNHGSLLVRERSALADPYCHSALMSVCLSVGVCVRNFEVKYLGNQRS